MSQATTLDDDLSLGEMVGILDVASTLRRESEAVREQFNLEETKRGLRQRLLAAAEASGEQLTAEQVDAAIERYYDNQHGFRPPPWGLSVALAHLYIRRVRVGIVAGVVLLGGLLVYWWS